MTTSHRIDSGDTAPEQRSFSDLEDEATILESNMSSLNAFQNEELIFNLGDTM